MKRFGRRRLESTRAARRPGNAKLARQGHQRQLGRQLPAKAVSDDCVVRGSAEKTTGLDHPVRRSIGTCPASATPCCDECASSCAAFGTAVSVHGKPQALARGEGSTGSSCLQRAALCTPQRWMQAAMTGPTESKARSAKANKLAAPGPPVPQPPSAERQHAPRAWAALCAKAPGRALPVGGGSGLVRTTSGVFLTEVSRKFVYLE